MLALIAALLAQQPPAEILVGPLEREGQTSAFRVGGTDVTIPPIVHSGTSLVGKRVQVVARRAEDGLEATLVHEIEPAERDLVLKVAATAEWGDAAEDDRIVVEVFEYYPNPRHRHRGSCRTHAWLRVRIEGKAGDPKSEREFRIPAYKEIVNVKTFVRVRAPRCAPSESREFSWNGKGWLDHELKAVEALRSVEVTVRAP